MCKSILVDSINNNIILFIIIIYIAPDAQHELIHRVCQTLVLVSIRRVRPIWGLGIHSCTSFLVYEPA